MIGVEVRDHDDWNRRDAELSQTSVHRSRIWSGIDHDR
jgi:hypothetical protein